MSQTTYFQLEDIPPTNSAHMLDCRVPADIAYEAMMQALLEGSAPLHAIVTTESGHGMALSGCQIADDKETIRDVLKRAEADFEQEQDIMRYEDEWNPDLNDSWW